MVELVQLGERLRLCDAEALATVCRSLAQHGQLAALTLFAEPGGLEIIDRISLLIECGAIPAIDLARGTLREQP